MRLDRFIANNSEFSRRDVKRLIKAGDVCIGDRVALDGGEILAGDEPVFIDGAPLLERGPGYLMFYKPTGVVCANSDNLYPTVFDYLPDAEASRMHIAGRLDLDTTGLVLVTGDGQWSHRITSPRSGCEKTYLATLAEPLDARMQKQLERGVFLKDEKARTAPAKIERVADDEIRLIITEGRYHQVKRMLAAVGNAVTALHREQIGAIQLDPQLQPGEYRSLLDEEIHSVP